MHGWVCALVLWGQSIPVLHLHAHLNPKSCFRIPCPKSCTWHPASAFCFPLLLLHPVSYTLLLHPKSCFCIPCSVPCTSSIRILFPMSPVLHPLSASQILLLHPMTYICILNSMSHTCTLNPTSHLLQPASAPKIRILQGPLSYVLHLHRKSSMLHSKFCICM